ncbi:P-loop containing nucleoside triphosphate hydrolase protein [Abortiporus biennis]|nr:P-loop containing nucleoside triphosphate hydrolase protein [Abortiporus biennis]
MPCFPRRQHSSQSIAGDIDQPITIALMGGTGTGKSSLINLVSGSSFAVGDGLKSCTSTVNATKPFKVNGTSSYFVLVDTPGFDDTTISDVDMLKLIAKYFADEFKSGRRLHGVIYLHRISDVRMGGTSRKNFVMFQKLCGSAVLPNVVIATTMWDDVDPEVGAARERQLREDEIFFKPVLEKGASLVRHTHTQSSAAAILRSFVPKSRIILRIQEELVTLGVDIQDTDACQALSQERSSLERKYSQELIRIEQGLEEAKAEHDMEEEEELLSAKNELTAALLKMEQQWQSLASGLSTNWETRSEGYIEWPRISSPTGTDFVKIDKLDVRNQLRDDAESHNGRVPCWSDAPPQTKGFTPLHFLKVIGIETTGQAHPKKTLTKSRWERDLRIKFKGTMEPVRFQNRNKEVKTFSHGSEENARIWIRIRSGLYFYLSLLERHPRLTVFHGEKKRSATI